MGQKYTSISDLYKQVKLNEQEIIERKLTPQELEDREKIAKKLPMADFKKRYGNDAMAVKMATATNIVKKKSKEEGFKSDAQRRAAFAQGYKAKGKKGKKEEVVKEGTWALPDTPKLKAGLKKLMQKPIPLGKDGDDAIKAIGKYIGDDGLYDDLYTASKKNGPKGDARPIIRGWMDRNFVDSWEKYRIETITILNRIDQKIQERKNG